MASFVLNLVLRPLPKTQQTETVFHSFGNVCWYHQQQADKIFQNGLQVKVVKCKYKVVSR